MRAMNLLCSTAALAAVTFLGCGRAEEPAPTSTGTEKQGVEAAALPVLNTFVNKMIQVDQLGSGVQPEDANLFVGADPADGSASVNKPSGLPAGAPPTTILPTDPFIDWDNLASAELGGLANHRLPDAISAGGGKDPSSFPQSNECVAPSQVLSKMELTYVAASNNNAWAYFAVQRLDNNGDAGYYWLFTKLEPRLIRGQAPCDANQDRLLYDISVGDVLLGGHFHPNGTPLLTVYKSQIAKTGVTALAAIDFTNSAIWAPLPGAVGAVAVNTTITAAGAFGRAVGTSLAAGGNVLSEIFAESAVPVHVFTGGSNCGAVFFGSVITRSSGSGGVNPDLKDLAGPAIFNFGRPTAQARLMPTCTLDVNFEASGIGLDGQPIVNPACSWTFDNGATATGCSGTMALPAGSRSATVTVSDPAAPGCAAEPVGAQVAVLPPLAVSADLQGNCNGSFTFSSNASGGTGNFSYLWSFNGAGTMSISGSPNPSGEVTVSTGNTDYSGTLTITDTRPDGLSCPAVASDVTRVLLPLNINLARQAAAPTCPGMSSDAARYLAIPSGGTGNYNLAWNGATCTGASCTIDPADGAFCYSQSFSVNVADADAARLYGIQCADRASELETYTKITTVTATDN
jgi:hypothetical protein